MALINCPECKIEQSNKAQQCTKCGYPIAEHFSSPENVFKVPIYPKTVKLSKRYGGFYWSPIIVDGFFTSEISPYHAFKDGKIEVALFQNGLRFTGKSFRIEEFSFHQIVQIKFESVANSATAQKSVLGRAAIGGVLLGGIGAVVGAFSGSGKAKKSFEYALSIIFHKDDAFHQIIVIFSGEKNADFARKIADYYDLVFTQGLDVKVAKKRVAWK